MSRPGVPYADLRRAIPVKPVARIQAQRKGGDPAPGQQSVPQNLRIQLSGQPVGNPLRKRQA